MLSVPTCWFRVLYVGAAVRTCVVRSEFMVPGSQPELLQERSLLQTLLHSSWCAASVLLWSVVHPMQSELVECRDASRYFRSSTKKAEYLFSHMQFAGTFLFCKL